MRWQAGGFCDFGHNLRPAAQLLAELPPDGLLLFQARARAFDRSLVLVTHLLEYRRALLDFFAG
jgi:hypothetical protein